MPIRRAGAGDRNFNARIAASDNAGSKERQWQHNAASGEASTVELRDGRLQVVGGPLDAAFDTADLPRTTALERVEQLQGVEEQMAFALMMARVRPGPPCRRWRVRARAQDVERGGREDAP